MFDVYITIYNRNRKGRKNYFSKSYTSLLYGGLHTCMEVNRRVLAVSHEEDDYVKDIKTLGFETLIPNEEISHIDNIEAVFADYLKGDQPYLFLLEDDILVPRDFFFEVARWLKNDVPHKDGIYTFMDWDIYNQDIRDRSKSYHKLVERGEFNTFTATVFHRDIIERFKGFDRAYQAPDTYFGKYHCVKNNIPMYLHLPGLIRHIGHESVAHKRCFDKDLGIVNLEESCLLKH